MATVRIYADNAIHTMDLNDGDTVAFTFKPGGRNTAPNNITPVMSATLRGVGERVVNAEWLAPGRVLRGRLRTYSTPFLRRMFWHPDLYRFDECVTDVVFL